MKKMLAYIQYILPQYGLTYVMGKMADWRTPWLKNYFIRRFIKTYDIDVSSADIQDLSQYPTFNSFFIRTLKAELRPIIAGEANVASPVDGAISQIGKIHKNQLLQIKHCYFDLESLLGGDTKLASTFYDGSFATLYLAPQNYHRVHMPLSGRLEKTIYVPGKLFSVNQDTSAYIPNLYSRNERLISIFSTQAGTLAVILVGAMIVGSIETVWLSSPVRSKKLTTTPYPQEISLLKGAELGRFKLGSTVILLFEKNQIEWNPALTSGSFIHFGQLIGILSAKAKN